MNILLTVVTFLMILILMTYARLDSFKSLWVTRLEFEKYMETNERAVANGLNEKKYDNTVAKPSAGGNPKQTIRAEGSPRLSWNLLINRDAITNQAAYRLIREMNAKLILTLFTGQKGFDDILHDHPNIINELFDRIGHAVEAQTKLKITKVSDLSNLELGDATLNHFLYLLFEGFTTSSDEQEKITRELEREKRDEDKTDETELNRQILRDLGNFRSDKGHVSLLDFITADRTEKVRVFLASPLVLYSIFGDKNVVNSILSTRVELYKEVHAGGKGTEATKKFEEAYKNKVPDELHPFLNFAVTNVDPRVYR